MKSCPRCQIPLDELTVGELKIDMCRTCEGSWYDAEELDAIMSLDDPLGDVRHSPLAPILEREGEGAPDLGKPAPCPVCGAQMDRYCYMLDSQVVIDRCNAHGVWLDDGELSGIVEHYVRSMRIDPETREKAMLSLQQLKLKNDPGLVRWVRRLFS